MIRHDRVGRWFAQRGWAHLTLLCGVCIFMFPFVWMVGMSMKTDEEAVGTDILPSIPTFRADSPVIRAPEKPERPDFVTAARWKVLLPLLIQQTRSALDPMPIPPGGDPAKVSMLREAAATQLTATLLEKLPEKSWSGDRSKLISTYAQLLTPDVLNSALENQLGRLEFTSLQIHALDGHIFNIDSGSQIAQTWKVESGPGKLLPDGEAASYLSYHFNSASDPPVILRRDFDAHVTADQLHKLVVSIVGDDSWHHIDATVDLGDTHWQSASTTYIAQYRASSIIFQPPGFDDTTYRVRDWITLNTVPGELKEPTPTTATLRIYVRPSSTLGAIYGKVQRNYVRAFRSVPFWTYVGNSVLLVVLQMVGALFSAAFVAYAFARLNWPGRSIAFGILLSTMMLPSQVTMIPSFVIWRSIGWFNTLNPLWVPAWFGSAFFIFLMTQNMKTIPRELEEAARIDGLNAVQTWWYIILPLVKPTLAAIAIMVFMGAWNDFMGPLIMLRDQSRYPLSLGLFGMHVDQISDSTLIMAGNMLMTLPVILIFFLFQRYFIEGVTVSGMKG
jgi:multiple sugar transport system permease protein